MVPAPVVANHPSALKRHRQALKRTERNKALRTRVRHIVRALRRAVEQRDTTAASETLGHARRELDKAVTKGILHRNNAARKISRLTRAVHQLTNAPTS
jgi:small subunit ribosomal protein S20